MSHKHLHSVHVSHYKHTAGCATEVMPIPDVVKISMSQHIGAPAKPIVAKGDRVLAGQKIAESGGFVSAPIYASVSGTVKSIETRRVVTGDLIQSIVIDNDGLYERISFTTPGTLSP